ncbi:glycosyltransferase family 4 protein [Actinophytocola sp.]|uniref:glycosyltransferase family 4 protein n=1 Tax=Actinophytocola sp. TaxID=1872138 RepID=UPI003D6C0CB7
MSATPSLVFLLDTPNIWRGQALAGTPARVLALAEHGHRAGATVTLALCDRGADYGTPADWTFDTLLVNPADFYYTEWLARALEPVPADFLVMCEAESLLAAGRQLAEQLGARLVYDVHDDEAALAASLGEPPEIVDRYESTQRAALAIADYVIVSTRHEAEMADGLVIPDRSALLPNGADPHQRTDWGPDDSSATLVFLGNLFYEPNARALTAIRTVVLPPLRAAGVDARVRVVGRGPADMTQPAENIEFTGRVDTVDEALRGATVALAPLTAGSGAKMKVLDYLAAGLPVLGTSEAVSGLPPEHPGVVVENDLSAWPSVLAELLRAPTRLRELGRVGRECVERELSWQQVGTDLLRHTHRWLSSPFPTARSDDEVSRPPNMPRWFADHVGHNALGEPKTTMPGRPRWLRNTRHVNPTAAHMERG